MADDTNRTARRLATLIAIPVAVLVGLAVFAFLGGFTRPSDENTATPRVRATAPVTVPAPPLSEQETVYCRALLAKLPETLGDAARRPVTAGAEQNAAYGDPPITLVCGGPAYTAPAEPAGPEDGFFGLSDVCWYAVESPGHKTWHLLDREVAATVVVPAGYDAPGQRVVGLSAAIVGSLPSVAEPQAGCLT